MKKQWIKPSLQVIVRHKPEETVLATCKHNDFGAVLSSTVATNCRENGCTSCTDVMPS